MPYIYSAVKETCETGLPIMRALWLHFADDPQAVGAADEYLFGRDLLVAPVVEKGATSRTLYLAAGCVVRLLDAGEARRRPRDYAQC